jgi:hypothetical protein
MVLHGVRSGSASQLRDGLWQALAAVALFVVGFLFFEGVIGISGRSLPIPDWVLPAAVIALGAAVLLRGVIGRRDEASES